MPNTPNEPGYDTDAEREDFDIAQDEWYGRQVYDNSSYWFTDFTADPNYSGERG